MSALRSDWPSTPDFHPEFGLLCPSPARRRSVRLATIALLAGIAIGATAGLAVAHWHDSGNAPSPTAGAIDELRSAEGSVAQAVLDVPFASAPPLVAAAKADELTVSRLQGDCKGAGGKGLAAAFLNPACDSGGPHARHAARTTYRVATVIGGRTEPAPADPNTVTVAAIEPSQAAVGAAGKAAIPTTQPVERAAPSKKPKAAPSAPLALSPPTRQPAQQDVGALAYAAAPRFGGSYFERAGDMFHAAAMPPSSGGPFGGI
jgi:hypothetical protein